MTDTNPESQKFEREKTIDEIKKSLLKIDRDLNNGIRARGFNPNSLSYLKDETEYYKVVGNLKDISKTLVRVLINKLSIQPEFFTDQDLQELHENSISSVSVDYMSPEFGKKKLDLSLQSSIYLQDNLFEIIRNSFDITKANLKLAEKIRLIAGSNKFQVEKLALTAGEWTVLLEFSINNNSNFPERHEDSDEFFENFSKRFEAIGVKSHLLKQALLLCILDYIESLITISKNTTFLYTRDTLNNALLRFHNFFQTLTFFIE